jgi:hypothetical protein
MDVDVVMHGYSELESENDNDAHHHLPIQLKKRFSYHPL